jgi:predicted MFS family arabinose efflux permease
VARAGVKAALAPLAERDFRLLFAGRTISRLGGSFSAVALAFAILEIGGGAGEVGLVFACFAVSQFLFVLFGGVWSDRLPRNRVMVGANLVEGAVQLAAATLVLTGTAEVWHIAVLAFGNGLAQAFFFPASQGIVPQLVSPGRLQEANALLRLSLNATNIGGAALAGAVVAAVGAGWAIAVDGASFLVCAVLLAQIRLPRSTLPRSRMLTELREGWTAFASRTWLWVIVLAFGFINAFWSAGLNVLGPLVAKEDLGGAAAWGLVVAASGAGLVAGGIVALQFRPRRPLRAGMLAIFALAAPLAALASGAPLPVVVAGALVAGVGIELFGVFWELSLQQHVQRDLLSRVAAYDMLGSIALMPVGYIVVGPVADGLGVHATLWACMAAVVALTAVTLAVRDVRTLERRDAPAPDDSAELAAQAPAS